jgi:hypothetical protein
MRVDTFGISDFASLAEKMLVRPKADVSSTSLYFSAKCNPPRFSSGRLCGQRQRLSVEVRLHSPVSGIQFNVNT